MHKILAVFGMFVCIAAGHAEMNTQPAGQASPDAARPPMLRNIGIAEPGDAIVVREREKEAAPLPKSSEQK